MSEEMQLAETLADLCIGRLNTIWGFKESAAFAFSALEVLPKDQQGPFALDLLQRVRTWKDYKFKRPAEVELVLLKAVMYEFMYAHTIARMEAAAIELLYVRGLPESHAQEFEKLLKGFLNGYSKKDPLWRMLRLINLAEDGCRGIAFSTTAHTLVQNYARILPELARDWKAYRN